MTDRIDIDAILDLTVQQRIGIVQVILDSIAAEFPPPPLSEDFKQELRRRRDEARANPEDGIPWEVVLAESLKRSR